MVEEDQVQESEQEQPQETEPAREPAEKQEEDKPEKEKDGGELLLPVLYALLAAVGAFTLVMIAGIVLSFIFYQSPQPSESPSAEPSSQVTSTSAQARQSPDGEGFSNEIPFSFL